MKRRTVTRVLQLSVLLAFTAVLALQPAVQALTPQERRTFAHEGIEFIDDPCSITGSAGTDVEAGISDEANAKVVIGIAKTYGLGKDGALIGLMTAITESHLQNYANSGIPISLDHPNAQATGNDHDSLGIMQQRVSTGWSTFGNYTNGADSEKDKNIVYQLMDPAYAAQAFFGTPPEAQLPEGLANGGALRKGLQNLEGGWQNMDPGAAAQAVQISEFPDRYNDNKGLAQTYLNNFWDSAPPIDLPIPITGGEAPIPGSGPCGTQTLGNIHETIVAYAWPTYTDAPYINNKPEYQAAIDAAQDRGEYVGGGIHPGVDCGGFTTRVMRDSGADPNFNDQECNTQCQSDYMATNPEKYRRVDGVTGTQDLPTDQGQVYIAIIASTHTYFYTGRFTYIDELGAEKTWSRDGASASIGPQSWRSPMASDAYDFTSYDWYEVL